MQTALRLRGHFGDAPFTIAEARTEGITSTQLRAAVAAGALHRPYRGVYYVPDGRADATSPDPTPSARALAHRLPGSAVSHDSAAQLLRLPVPLHRPRIGHVTMPGSRARLVGSVFLHAGMLPSHHRTLLDGTWVTTASRTAIDLARITALPEALICMDAVLRRHIDMSRDADSPLRIAVHDTAYVAQARMSVVSTLGDMIGWPGTRSARHALELADPAAESALESVSRGVLLGLGIPRPVCGFPVRGHDRATYWADMAWEAARVIGECDGLVKYADPKALYREKLRQEALERAGWRVVRWTYADITRDPASVAERLGYALTRRVA